MLIEAAQGPLHGYIAEAVSGAVLSVLGWIVFFPVRTVYTKASAEWFRATAQLDEVNKELTTQRTNCLQTLQNQGDTQIGLLKETVKVLNDMHLDQRTLLGRLDRHE
jgi:hypothetical protein